MRIPTVDQVCDAMAPIIVKGIASDDTDAPVFHGNVDWHSAVHGHWALFRIDRATGRHAGKAKAADASMTPELIAKERAFLQEHPDFEMPYGRAWFLLLTEEFEKWSVENGGKDPKRLRNMADDVAASLFEHYVKEKPSPLSREYDNAAWALVRLHRWYGHTGGERNTNLELQSMIAGMKGLKTPANGFAFDREHPDFFSRFGNFAYLQVARNDSNELTKFLASHPIRDGDIAPCVDVDDAAHHLGTNWSRAWSLKALSAAAKDEGDRKRFRKAYEAHLVQGMKQHEKSAGDFWAYDHWVPQFAVYAITDGDAEKKK